MNPSQTRENLSPEATQGYLLGLLYETADLLKSTWISCDVRSISACDSHSPYLSEGPYHIRDP